MTPPCPKCSVQSKHVLDRHFETQIVHTYVCENPRCEFYKFQWNLIDLKPTAPENESHIHGSYAADDELSGPES